MIPAVKLQLVGLVENNPTSLLPTDLAQREDLREIVNAEVEAFDTFFQTLDNSALTGPERALLDTYLWWKTHPTPRR